MIYLDNAASAFISEETCDYLKTQATTFYANQEAVHGLAYDTRKALDRAKELSCELLTGNGQHHLFWFGSGTEAIWHFVNCSSFSGGNIVTTKLEHPAVTAAIGASDTEGRYCAVKRDGKIDVDSLQSCLDHQTKLVIIHYVQGELGIIQDLVALRQIINEKAPHALFVIDSIQAVGKMAIPWEEAGLDGLFFSGHKFGVPGGAGIVLRKERAEDICGYLESLRKEAYKVGRLDPAIALTCSYQLERLFSELDKSYVTVQELSQTLRTGLKKLKLLSGKQIILLNDNDFSSPFITSFLVPGYQAAVLVRMLSQKKIYISAGSACQAETNKPNKALGALGYKKDLAYSGLRCSLWQQNTKTDIEQFLEAFENVLKDY